LKTFLLKKIQLLKIGFSKIFKLDDTPILSYLDNAESPLDYYFRKHGFITEWTIDNSDLTVTLPTVTPNIFSEGVYACVVDWGDGTSNTLKSFDDVNITHTYSKEGTYRIEIKGYFTAWSMDSLSQTNKNKLRKVIYWGGNPFHGFNYLEKAFNNCNNLTDLSSSYIKKYNDGCLSFSYFCNNTSIKTIKCPLFSHHINAISFDYCFSGISNLEKVCNNFFNKNINAVTFNNAFSNCIHLKFIPEKLFYYNRKANDFSFTFYNTPSLLLYKNLFYYDFDQSTRFNEITDITFESFIERNSFSLIKTNNAIDLWNCTFFGTINKSNAFAGDGNILAFDNYDSIPNDWKGL